MQAAQIRSLVKEAVSAWIDDYAPSMGAALAYYTLFSIAPLLLIVISIAGLVFGRDAAEGHIFAELRGLMGADGAAAIQALLKSVARPTAGIVATAVGVVLLLVGAMTVFGELQDALDRIWRAPARLPGSTLLGLVHSRLLSFGMILGIGFLLIVSLLASTAVGALGSWWKPWLGGFGVLLEGINLVVSFGLITTTFAMIYKIMPRVRIEWPDVWIGAAVTALLFTVGKLLIGLYIGSSGLTSGFGAAASLVAVLVWMYYSAQIFLLGAEFTWVYAHTFGSHRGDVVAEGARPVPTRSGAAPVHALAASRAALAEALRGRSKTPTRR